MLSTKYHSHKVTTTTCFEFMWAIIGITTNSVQTWQISEAHRVLKLILQKRHFSGDYNRIIQGVPDFFQVLLWLYAST